MPLLLVPSYTEDTVHWESAASETFYSARRYCKYIPSDGNHSERCLQAGHVRRSQLAIELTQENDIWLVNLQRPFDCRYDVFPESFRHALSITDPSLPHKIHIASSLQFLPQSRFILWSWKYTLNEVLISDTRRCSYELHVRRSPNLKAQNRSSLQGSAPAIVLCTHSATVREGDTEKTYGH